MAKKNIAIIGGRSVMAQYLVPVLRDHGHTVTTMGRVGCDVALDLSQDISAFHMPDGVNTVIHLAAAFGGPHEADVMRTIDVNINGALKSCMVARAAKAEHFIYISTIYTLLPDTHPYATIYGATKREAENKLNEYCRESGMALTVLRPSQIYDSRGLSRRHQGMPYFMADCAEAGQVIPIYGEHDARRNYIHIDDVVVSISAVAERDIDGTFSCTFPSDVSLSSMAAAAEKAFGSSAGHIFQTDRPSIPDAIFAFDGSLYQKTGHVPNVDMDEGMRRIAVARKEVVS